MNALELGLLGMVSTLVGCGGGIWIGNRGKVPKTYCDLMHKNESETMSRIEHRLERIEGKLDRMNNGGKNHAL